MQLHSHVTFQCTALVKLDTEVVVVALHASLDDDFKLPHGIRFSFEHTSWSHRGKI